MLKKISTMTELKHSGKKVVALLSFGTFFEYLDLMLYVHMGVLLNELFFEATNPHSVALLSALGVFLTFAGRPIGAYLFGFIGDNYGRISVLYITTILMAISCLTMAWLPTYAQIGFTASIVITLCRLIQSLSSVGEVTSCDLYLIETTAPPIQYPITGVADVFGALGGTVALGIASLVTMYEFNWRWAFLFGFGIAFIGFYARKTLLETSEFSNAQTKINLIVEKFNVSYKKAKKMVVEETEKQAPAKKISLALFVIQCVFPLYYYFAYIYCGDLLKSIFNYSSVEVIHNNFILSFAALFTTIFIYWISYYINPLKILKIQLVLSSIFILFLPYLLNNLNKSIDLIIIQYLTMILAVHGMPAFPIFYKYIPVLQRFKTAGLQYSLGRAVMFGITSFGLVYLTEWFGNIGLFGLFAVTLTAYTIALFYFDKLEKESNNSKT
jgi:MHS family proline/betaine transporter-like MFS transporter